MPTAPTAPTMTRGDAAQIITSHLYLVDTHGREVAERCSHCRRPWPCPDRSAAELVLYGRELDR